MTRVSILILLLPLAAPAAAAAAPERVVTRPVPLPSSITGVKFPHYTADGSRLLAAAGSRDFAGTQLVSFRENGSGLRCLTCGAWSGPPLQKMFPLPDGRRLLVRIGVQTALSAARHGIVECSPSVVRCERANVVPIEPPAADDPNVLQTEREFRVSPDGRHVTFTQIRTTASGLVEGVGVVGRLVRGPSAYRIANARVVATGGEVKNFTPDGRGILVAAFNGAVEAGNPDNMRIDLRTGRETRVTHSLDWEEDIDIGAQRHAGKRWMVVGSARGSGLLETVSQIRRPPAIDPAISGLPYRVYTFRNAEIAEPWLVSLPAERRGALGQPLAPGAIGSGWNSRANFSFKPDGTAVTFWQRRIEDERVSRVMVARLPERRARPERPVTPLRAPRWAPPLAGYVPPDPASLPPRPGKISGRMLIRRADAPPGSGYARSIEVRYRRFSDRPGEVIDGVERGLYDEAGLFGANSLYSADLRLSGRRRGFLRAERVAITLGEMDGVIRSRVGDRRLTLGPLP